MLKQLRLSLLIFKIDIDMGEFIDIQNEKEEVSLGEKMIYYWEFRRRFLSLMVIFILCFVPTYYFANSLYSLISDPLLALLPSSDTASFIATDVTTAFFTPLKLAFYVTFFLTAPFFLYHFWSFVSPALYIHEKKLLFAVLVGSSFLFYLGIAFAYWVVLPLLLHFFVVILPEFVQLLPDISQYLSLALKLFLAFGLAFQVPIGVFLLLYYRVVTHTGLSQVRGYVFVGAFVVGMLLTPPDVISQILLAIPMWLLFELGLILGRLLVRDVDETKNAKDD